MKLLVMPVKTHNVSSNKKSSWMITMLPSDWRDVLEKEFKKDYFKKLVKHVKDEYKKHTCYPPLDHVFHALRLTPYNKTKVLLLGQDPYHNPNQAMGLAF